MPRRNLIRLTESELSRRRDSIEKLIEKVHPPNAVAKRVAAPTESTGTLLASEIAPGTVGFAGSMGIALRGMPVKSLRFQPCATAAARQRASQRNWVFGFLASDRRYRFKRTVEGRPIN
jgi:hypothetical protein